MNTKICTSVEQSKKLLELGLDDNTADMYYPLYEGIVDPPQIGFGYLEAKKLYIPAWSLSALFELMPSEFVVEGKYGTYIYEIHIRKYKFTKDVDLHQITYGRYGDSGSWHDMINTPEKENLIDAVFEMICWLLKNKKI